MDFVPDSPKPSECFLVKLVLIVSLTSSAFGIALVTTDALGDTYMAKLGWKEDSKSQNMTYFTCASAVGLMIGSLASSSVVKIGRRKAAIFANLVALVGGALQLMMNFYMILAGKIVYGMSAGVLITACALYLSETLPPEKVGSHGFAVNLGVTLGISLVLALGPFVPTGSDIKDS